MKLYFLRHGIAQDISSTGADRDRELTAEGIAEMEREAEGLKRLNLDLDLILSSPYSRALETARIVAKELGLMDRLSVDSRLEPGFRLKELQEIVEDLQSERRVMLVGHNFDFPVIAGELAGGAEIELKKGGLIRVGLDQVEPGTGAIEWVLTPRHLIAIGGA